MISLPRPSHFSACNIENWEEPGDEASIELLAVNVGIRNVEPVIRCILKHIVSIEVSCLSQHPWSTCLLKWSGLPAISRRAEQTGKYYPPQ